MNNGDDDNTLAPASEATTSLSVSSLRVRTESNKDDDRHHILGQVYRNLEDLAYIQSAAILYCDQSILFAFTRWNVINNYTSAASFAAYRVPVILVLNLICTLWHLFGERPKPVSDGTRGYLSGSAVIDLVGEIPPSRLRLLYLDVLFLTIQMLMVVVGHEQQKFELKSNGGRRRIIVVEPPEPAQDLDAEEQGIQRNERSTEINTTSVDDNEEEEGGGIPRGPDNAALLSDRNRERQRDHTVAVDSNDSEDDGSIPVLRLNMTNSIREIMRQDSTVDEAVTAQRAQNRARLRRLLGVIAQRATRE